MKKSRFWFNLLIIGTIVYQLLNMINNAETKPIGTISFSQYLENVKSQNINRIIIENYSDDVTVFTKEPVVTLEYQKALEENRRFEESDNLTYIEKAKKTLSLYPNKEEIEKLKSNYYEKSYHVLISDNVKNLFDKITISENNISVEVVSMGIWQRLFNWVLGLLPMMLFLFFIIGSSIKMQESGILADFKNRKNEKKSNVKLSDVVGIEEELKLDVIEVIDFIKNPEKYRELKAKMPKGILMVGQPGVGKTLLAKAIANESDVDFFYRSASDLENPYVGMSAKTVKNLFEEARKSKNAIIFIDEIDAIGSRYDGQIKTNTGLINALLTEMDGFTENENIVVIAATNHPEKLDKALLREGRFDRTISIPLPTVQGRKEILEFYLKDKKTLNVDIDTLARLTTEYSGAALAGIVNEASIQAVREGSGVITQEHLMKARDKKIMGVPYKNFEQSEHQKEITAYHEAGHAVLSYFLDKNHELYKVSILPRTNSLGVTVSVPLQENINYNKTELENMLQILFGGRIAEEIFFNEISTGAHNDIERANNISEKMIKEFGMSRLGLLHIDNTHLRKHSEDLLKQIDYVKQEILNENYEKAKQFLENNKELVEKIALALIEKEEIDFEDIKALMS